jgi:ribosomal protein S8
MPDSAAPGRTSATAATVSSSVLCLQHAQQVSHRGRLELETVECVARRERGGGAGIVVGDERVVGFAEARRHGDDRLGRRVHVVRRRGCV